MLCGFLNPCLMDPVAHGSPGYKSSVGLANSIGPLLPIGLDHGRSHLAPAEHPLDRSDAVASLQQTRGTTWPQASVAEPLGLAEGMQARGSVGGRQLPGPISIGLGIFPLNFSFSPGDQSEIVVVVRGSTHRHRWIAPSAQRQK